MELPSIEDLKRAIYTKLIRVMKLKMIDIDDQVADAYAVELSKHSKRYGPIDKALEDCVSEKLFRGDVLPFLIERTKHHSYEETRRLEKLARQNEAPPERQKIERKGVDKCLTCEENERLAIENQIKWLKQLGLTLDPSDPDEAELISRAKAIGIEV